MTVNLEHCKTFYCVANCGSITTAAQKLFISQPAVSQSVKQLERQLGCALFFRTSKGVKLTAEGEVFYSRVKRAFDEIEQGERELSEMLGMESGEIRIGASDMTLQFFLLPYLEQFHKQYPNIRISVSNGPTPETLFSLREGSIDLGIVSTPVDLHDDISIFECGEINDIFVAGKRFEYLKDKVISLLQLEKLPVIFLEKNTSTRRSIDEFLRKCKVEIVPEIELATSELIVRFAERDLGIGFVMSGFAKEEIESGRLFELKLDRQLPKRQVCIAVSRKRPVSVAAARIIGLIDDKIIINKL